MIFVGTSEVTLPPDFVYPSFLRCKYAGGRVRKYYVARFVFACRIYERIKSQ